MREVGAFEAKNKLGQLLDLIERGEEIIIRCRRNKPSTATRRDQQSGASASAWRS